MTSEQLEKLITEAATAYYSGQPIMSDKKFDDYVQYLKMINPDSSVLKTTGWGYSPEQLPGNKVKHPHGGMGSIEIKPRSIEEMSDDFRHNVRITPKLDGLSGVVHIVNGKFVRCITRGDGVIGVDKTDKFKAILERCGELNIPEDVSCEIRGEFVISNENWNKMLAEGTYKKNSRNAASGIINSDSITSDIQYLDFVPYKIIYLEGKSFVLPEGEIGTLHKWFSGFPHIDYLYSDDYYDEQFLLDAYLKWKEQWPCDGVVITQYNVVIFKNCVEHKECAYKFDTLKKATKVVSIDWQQSRLNLFKPVANLEPIELGGAVIKRVTLHNAATVKARNIKPGTEVLILRSGDVIPYLEDVIQTDDSTEVILPCICPCCGATLEWQGVDLKCSNPQCSNISQSQVKIWLTTIAPIDGFGETLLEKYLDRFGINSIEDVYTVDLDNLKYILIEEGVQSLKFFQTLSAVRQHLIPLKNALLALNIPRLGQSTSEALAGNSEFIHFIQKYIASDCGIDYLIEHKEELHSIICKVIGEATADSITNNLDCVNNLRFISNQLVMQASMAIESKGTVCITGTLKTISRKELVTRLKAAGWQVKEDITKKVSYLITNTPDSDSSKNKKANQLGIPKLTETEFIEKFLV